IGLNRRLKTRAKRMGLRIGAARRIPTSTTTVAARPSITRKMDGWRSAVVIVSPMPDLSSAWLFEDSFMIQPPSCAWLCCQTQCTVFSSCLAWFLLLLTQLSSRLGSQSSVALQPPFPLTGDHGYLSPV